MSDSYALILAGGRGARFWPRSRRDTPKQCLSVDGGPTLIQQALSRLEPLVPVKNILVVTGPDMEASVRAQLPSLPAENILIEPQPRNTAPGIGLGAVEVERRAGPDAVVACLPADQIVTEPDALRAALSAAMAAARAEQAIVTLGITPTFPATGYGYLSLGAQRGTFAGQAVYQVDAFREKPDRQTAAAYLAAGGVLWNAGMFVFRVADMRAAFAAHLPRSSAALDAIAADPGALRAQWGEMEATSIDYGIMERSDRVLTVPCDAGWSDVGSWEAAAALMPEEQGHRALAALLVSVEAAGCVVYAPEKLVALLGVEDLVVVDSPDALLVTRRDRAQSVRDIVRILERSGQTKYT